MILTVTMNPSIDTRYTIDHLVVDDVNRVVPQKTAGGKGLNVSRVLCQLGDDVIATGLLGGHMGAFLADRMDDDGIPHDFVSIAASVLPLSMMARRRSFWRAAPPFLPTSSYDSMRSSMNWLARHRA